VEKNGRLLEFFYGHSVSLDSVRSDCYVVAQQRMTEGSRALSMMDVLFYTVRSTDYLFLLYTLLQPWKQSTMEDDVFVPLPAP
jgi:hypothetical protein